MVRISTTAEGAMPQTNSLDFSTPAAGEKSLKTISQQFGRAGQPVVTSEFSPKPKRTSDTTYREAYVTFASGQQLTLRVNTTGDIYQVLINNAVKPLKEQADTAKAIAEIAGLVTKNQAAFQKAQARKKVTIPKGMTTPKPKVLDALAQQNAELDTKIADRQTRLAALTEQLGQRSMLDSVQTLDPVTVSTLKLLASSAIGAGSPKLHGVDALIGLGYAEYTDAQEYIITAAGVAAAITVATPEPVPDFSSSEPASWYGFQIVNQQFIDQQSASELPSRFPIGAEVQISVSEGPMKDVVTAYIAGINFRFGKVHYSLAVPISHVGGSRLYAILYDIDSVYVGAPGEAMLDGSGNPAVIQSLDEHKSKSAEVLPLASAYVAARELAAATGTLLDDASTLDALAHLQIGLDVVETNGPISLEEGNLDQARLQLRLAKSFRAAMAMLDSAKARPMDDAALAQLVIIAKADAASEDEVADQEALATLLAAGVVDVLEGIYFVSEKGRQYLNDNGMDAYGEPFGE